MNTDHTAYRLSSDDVAFITDRAALTARLDAICILEAATFGAPWKRVDFVNELTAADARCMMLLLRDGLAGYLFARVVLDEISLNKICIAADFRGRGLGTALLGGFIDALRGSFSKMFLEVDATNTPAVHLYTRFGFRTVRVRKAIYEDGADGLEMMLTV